MATSRNAPKRPRRPASTPEQRENQMISLAVDVAERQMREGTASSQVITHFLKMGSVRESLERDRLEQENELLKAKVAQIESNERREDLYEKALNAMRTYSGQDPNGDEL